MGSIGNDSGRLNEEITGHYTTRKGITYNYQVHKDKTVDVWTSRAVPSKGGYKSKDFYTNPTKELINHIEEKYKIKGVR